MWNTPSMNTQSHCRTYLHTLNSETSPYGCLHNIDTSLLWTVHLFPKIPKHIIDLNSTSVTQTLLDYGE